MPDDHLVDFGLGELLGLDHVLLAGAEEVVEECHIELEHLDELDDPSVRNTKLPIKIEGSGIALTAQFSDTPVVDVPGEFRRILILLILFCSRISVIYVIGNLIII